MLAAISPACAGAGFEGESDVAPLRISVYATASDVLQFLAKDKDRELTLRLLRQLDVTRVFLEGRRGGEYAAPEVLREVRGFLERNGISSTGGIATVPGDGFGVRQTGDLDWLNWQVEKTQTDVARFFAENAPVFDDIVVDDFYCTGDVSAGGGQARGTRSWGEYRRDLLASLIPPMILEPTRVARAETRLIMKFPQWYDRFHMFGYDPARMAPLFHEVWVGTEVRNPHTRRMGFVQPTEGYVNFSWIRSVAGPKVRGAWFDHIECTPENFMDQAYQSVLAGAHELTLFRLGDVMNGHSGDALLASNLAGLRALSARVRSAKRMGISFYKPCGSDPGGNLYLADYLAVLGWPVLPVGAYPARSKAIILAAQAAADPDVLDRLDKSLRQGASVVVTPEFLRRVDPKAQAMAGVSVGLSESPGNVPTLAMERDIVSLPRSLDVDRSLQIVGARVIVAGTSGGGELPVLTSRQVGRGRLLVLNVRTFSEQDFRDVGEVLLSPRQLGLSELPQPVSDVWRRECLGAALPRIEAPAGVSVALFRGGEAAHNFRSIPVTIRVRNRRLDLQPHECAWIQP